MKIVIRDARKWISATSVAVAVIMEFGIPYVEYVHVYDENGTLLDWYGFKPTTTPDAAIKAAGIREAVTEWQAGIPANVGPHTKKVAARVIDWFLARADLTERGQR